MRFYTADEVRMADEASIRGGISERDLMRRAARGIAGRLVELARATGVAAPRLLFAAGKGNNGGDAIAAAALLREAGWNVAVWLAADPANLTGEPAFFLSHYRALGGELRVCPAESDWSPEPGRLPFADIVVDGLLGTGARGAPARQVAAAARWINALAEHARVVALDFPTGVDATTGEAHEPHVIADATLCLGLPKVGLLHDAARVAAGAVEMVDIGFTSPGGDAAELEMVDGNVRALIRPRERAAHKGGFGRVLVVGGSPGLSGAAGLAARGALASGAGLVDVIVPPDLVSATAVQAPGAMVHPGQTGRDGGLSAELWPHWENQMGMFDAVVAGPGMGGTTETLQVLRRLLLLASKPVVLDADALNAFAGRAHWIEKRSGPAVLTPHPGELARLMGNSVEEVQADRRKAAESLAALTGSVVVLKGQGTLIAEKGRATHINLNGNPAMARGGTGDLLAGLLGGLLAQGLAPFDAACLAVWLHGRAGDLATWRRGPSAVSVGDITDALASAWTGAGILR